MNGKGSVVRPKHITAAEWDARYAGTFCTDYRPDPYAQMVADSQAFTATETARVDALCAAPRSKVATLATYDKADGAVR